MTPGDLWRSTIANNQHMTHGGLWHHTIWLMVVCDITPYDSWWFVTSHHMTHGGLWHHTIWLMVVCDITPYDSWWFVTSHLCWQSTYDPFLLVISHHCWQLMWPMVICGVSPSLAINTTYSDLWCFNIASSHMACGDLWCFTIASSQHDLQWFVVFHHC